MPSQNTLQRTVPAIYHPLLEKAQQRYHIKIDRPISEGFSDAFVARVRVRRLSNDVVYRCIMKLFEQSIWDANEGSEEKRHQLAKEQSPPEFAEQKIVNLIDNPIIDDSTPDAPVKVFVLYQLAGDSTIQYKSLYEKKSKENTIQSVLEVKQFQLLRDWHSSLSPDEEDYNPANILKAWLGYRVESESNLLAYLRQKDISKERIELRYKSLLLPNPIAYIQRPDLWNGHQQAAFRGHIHGDLHLRNLMVKTSFNDHVLDYQLIDFALYQQKQFLFFDQQYLKFSWYLTLTNQESSEKLINHILRSLEESISPGVESMMYKLIDDLCEKGLKKWMEGTGLAGRGFQSDLRGQYLLAGIAVGLNFCNKRLPGGFQDAAFFYAARCLKLYLEEFTNMTEQPAQEESGDFILTNSDRSISRGLIDEEWEKIKVFTDYFNYRQYLLVLLIDPKGISKATAKGLCQAEWSIILDLDPKTRDTGFYSKGSDTLKNHRGQILLTYETADTTEPDRPFHRTYWYAVRGIAGISTIDDNHHEWEIRYAYRLRQYFSQLPRYIKNKPVRVLVIADNYLDHVTTICRQLQSIFLDVSDIKFAYITQSEQTLKHLQRKQHPGTSIVLSVSQLAARLRQLHIDRRQNPVDIYIPSDDGTEEEIPQDVYNDMLPDIEIIHKDIHLINDTHNLDEHTRASFLQGSRITWKELADQLDIWRPEYNTFKQEVLDLVREGGVQDIWLNHFPGAGGSTIARRVAWELHEEYPVLLAKNISINVAKHISRLRENYTRRSILVFIELGNNKAEDIGKLRHQILNLNVQPVILIIVQRVHEQPGNAERPDNSPFYVGALTRREADPFLTRYIRELTALRDAEEISATRFEERSRRLYDFTSNYEYDRNRVPFFFGLFAFEEQFSGINTYIESALEDANTSQIRLLCYMAMIAWYGDREQGIDPHLFRFITSESSSTMLLNEYFSDPQQRLLIAAPQDDDASSPIVWKFVHSLLAEQTFKYIMQGNTFNPEVRWQKQLMNWSQKFIRDISPGSKDNLPADIVSLLEKMFIMRRRSDVIHDKFSRLVGEITDAGTEDSFTTVLGTLHEEFAHPHFSGHYARALGHEGDYDKAITVIDDVLGRPENEDDNVLWHIKGMIWYRKIRTKTRDLTYRIKNVSAETPENEMVQPEDIREIFYLLTRADEAFTNARKYSTGDTQHGHISHIHAIINILQFALSLYRSSQNDDRLSFADMVQDEQVEHRNHYLDLHQEANILLQDVKGMPLDSVEEDFARQAHNRLKVLKARDYQEQLAIIDRALDNATGRSRVKLLRYKVNTFWQENDASWNNWTRTQYETAYNILEDILLADPGKSHDIRNWFHIAMHLDHVEIKEAITRMEDWNRKAKSVEPLYFLYILYTIRAIRIGIPHHASTNKARTYGDQLTQITGDPGWRGNRRIPFYCYGRGEGLKQCVYYRALGEYRKNLFADSSMANHLLERVKGTITKIKNPASGIVTIDGCGLTAFFVPGEKRSSDNRSFTSNDITQSVDFYLGFRYSGLTAYEVDFRY